MEWYNNRSNVLSLLDFLIGAELIDNAEDVIQFSKHPERYSDVYTIYEREILGLGME